jgi:pyruvate/2-oxoglutarate dehydrogenase complex dihydrolipoamide acyltransferase (E2) component
MRSLAHVVVEVGDYVEQDEEIATIETDKVWSF